MASGTETELYRRFKLRQSFWSQIPKLPSEAGGAEIEGLEECAAACVSNNKCTAFFYGTDCSLAKVMMEEVVTWVDAKN